MEKSNPSTLLKQLILIKQEEQESEGKLLKEHFHLAYESLRPINIIKDTIKEAIASPSLKTNVVNAAIGITSGFIAKKIFTGRSHNPLTHLSGIILEILVASKIANNADDVKSIAGILFKKIVNQFSDPEKL